jgi:chromosome segregation ATPase
MPLSPPKAREKGCRVIEGAPITISAGPRHAWPDPSGRQRRARRAPAGRRKVDPAAQRQRDSDARRILADELKTEEDKLAALQKDYNNGEPERRGDERNYQRYLDRVAEMKAAIARKEADIAALKRELAKLPP